MILNSMGWIVELGYELLKHTIEVRSCHQAACCLLLQVVDA